VTSGGVEFVGIALLDVNGTECGFDKFPETNLT